MLAIFAVVKEVAKAVFADEQLVDRTIPLVRTAVSVDVRRMKPALDVHLAQLNGGDMFRALGDLIEENELDERTNGQVTCIELIVVVAHRIVVCHRWRCGSRSDVRVNKSRKARATSVKCALFIS